MIDKALRSPKQEAAQPECISRVAGRQRVPHLLAASGVGSLRDCNRLIQQRRVTVNGQVVLDVAEHAHPERDEIAVDGQPIVLTNFCRYLAFHKPYLVMSSFTDPEDQGRATLADYVAKSGIDAAGRLDYDSEGLMILTDDGWLNHRLTHPDWEHPKTYLVQVEGLPDATALHALREGVMVKEERTRPAQVDLLTREPRIHPRSTPIHYRATIPTAWLRVTLREGRKRQIRHMTAAVGCPTLRLIRIAIGPVSLGDLAPGQSRELTTEELAALSRLLRQRPASAPPVKKSRAPAHVRRARESRSANDRPKLPPKRRP